MEKTYTTNVLDICENGDALVELPQDLLDQQGWGEGTVLNIEKIDGQIIISRKD